jgi:hypothetical protein
MQVFDTLENAEPFLAGLRRVLPHGYSISAIEHYPAIGGSHIEVSVLGRKPLGKVSRASVAILNAYREGALAGQKTRELCRE